LEIGPPLDAAALREQQRDIELRLDIFRPMPREIEIAVPRHLRERAVEHRMRIVPKAGRILDRREATARGVETIDREHAQTGLGEIGREDETVMAGADHDAVV